MSDNAFAFGLGVGSHNSKGEWLEVFFPDPILKPSAALAVILAALTAGIVLWLDRAQVGELGRY